MEPQLNEYVVMKNHKNHIKSTRRKAEHHLLREDYPRKASASTQSIVLAVLIMIITFPSILGLFA